MQTVLITGGTGMIGRNLTKHLTGKGHRVIILTRKIPSSPPPAPLLSFAIWDTRKKFIDTEALRNATAIIHLAGAGVVDKKWTRAYKEEIIKSRTESSALLIDALKRNANRVTVFVSASAAGWYGEDPPPHATGFVETDPPDKGFLGETCRLWEQSVEPVEKLGIRLVKLRTGIVLSKDGGALQEFAKPIRLGVAGILGSGNQVVSWIHVDDLCRMYVEAVENPALKGSYNAVAPRPVSNKILTLELAQQMNGNWFIPLHVPEFALKIMMGDRSTEVLKSTTVSSQKIREAGFDFLYPGIETALQNLMQSKKG